MTPESKIPIPLPDDPLDAEMKRIQSDPLEQEMSRLRAGQSLVQQQQEATARRANPRQYISPEQATRSGVAMSRIATSAVLRPVQALAQAIGLDGAAEKLSEIQAGITTTAERDAQRAGIPDEEIARVASVGQFIGTTLPLSASFKAVKLLGLSAEMPILTDVAAGVFYGGVLEPGSPQERLRNAAWQGGQFGAWGLAFRGALYPFVALRRIQFENQLKIQAAEDLARVIEEGAPVTEPKQGEQLFRILGQQNYVLASPAAQEILKQQADLSVIAQGILDSGGNGGILHGFEGPFERVAGLEATLRAQMPTKKVQSVKMPDGTFSIHFSDTGLNNQQIKQLKTEGFYSGQRLMYRGEQVEYIGQTPKRMVVRDLTTGKARYVKPTNVTELLKSVDPELKVPKLDALYQDFETWAAGKIAQAADAQPGLRHDQLIKAVREGTVTPDGISERAIGDPDMVISAAEVGPVTAQLIKTGPPKPEAMQLFGQAGAEMAGQADAVIVGQSAGGPTPWRMTVMAQGQPVGHFDMPTVEEAMSSARAMGFETLQSVQGKQGNLFTLAPAEPIGFEELVAQWAKDKDLAGADLRAHQVAFAQRLRARLWSMVPEEDRALLTRMKDEYDALYADRGETLAEAAAARGFHTEVQHDQIVLRDINSGAEFPFVDEASARAALAKAARPGDAGWASPLPDDFGGINAAGVTGLPQSDGEWFFPDNVLSREFGDAIPMEWSKSHRRWFQLIEEKTGIPIWSRGFDPLMQNYAAMDGAIQPWAKRTDQEVTKLGSRMDRVEVGRFMRAIESLAEERGAPIMPEEVESLGRQMGMSEKQIRIAKNTRDIFNVVGRIAGIPEDMWVHNYYSRIQPYAESHGTLDIDPQRIYGSAIPTELKKWYEYSRTGDMARVELDPAIVLHKYIRTVFWDQHMSEPWKALAQFTYDPKTLRGWGGRPVFKVKDLPPERQAAIRAHAPEAFDPNAPVMHPLINRVLNEYLLTLRGHPTAGMETARRFTRKLFKSLDIQADDRIVDELLSMGMSTMYGSAMGARPAQWTRQITQNVSNLYPRIGGRFAGPAMRRAMTLEGFHESVEAGAVRQMTAAVPYGDVIFEHVMEGAPQGQGIAGVPVAAALRGMLKAGEISRRATERLLVPFESGDEFNRAWAYHWHKMHTASWLDRLEAKRISEARFIDEGLPFFSKAVKNEFMDRLRRFGREDALRFIGRQAADETNFIYGMGSQPLWMQTSFGRLAGMFGTFSLNQKDLFMQAMKYGTMGQRAGFIARSAAVVGALGLIGYYAGVNITGYLSPAAVFNWAGGPAVDYLIDLKQLVDAPVDQKAAAARRLARDVGGLAFPGQMFLSDLGRMQDETDDPRLAALLMMLGRPTKRSSALQWGYDPSIPLVPPMDPERWEILQNRDGRPARGYVPPALTLPSDVNAAAMQRTGSVGGVDLDKLMGENR